MNHESPFSKESSSAIVRAVGQVYSKVQISDEFCRQKIGKIVNYGIRYIKSMTLSEDQQKYS